MANTKVTGDLIASSTIVEGNIANNAVTSGKISGITTAHITEGSNLYYTDARADARIAAADTGDLSEGSNLYYTNTRADARITAALIDEDNMSSNSATRLPSQQSVKAYVDAQILTKDNTDEIAEGSSNLYYTDARADARAALVVDSAPSTLNTLNELAAALGDDANFSTTVTNSIAAKLPLAGGTMTGDVTFNGDTYHMMWDKSENRLEFWDNAKLSFGDPGGTPDLLIYHDGSNSYIKEQGTGELLIRSNLIALQNAGGTENMAKFIENGAVQLYYNDSQKLATASSGVRIGTSTETANTNFDDLVIENVAGHSGITIFSKSDSDGAIYFGDVEANNLGQIKYSHGSNAMTFATNDGAASLTLDSGLNGTFAGNVTATGFNTTVGSTEKSLLTRNSSNTAVYIQQAGTGNIVDFRYGSQSAGQGTSAMVIDDSGNIGIGTITPTARLDILTSSATGTNSIDRHVRFRADNGEQRFDFFPGRSGNSSYLGMYDAGETLGVFIAPGGDSYFNGGSLGIGTTTSPEKLTVNGNIITKGGDTNTGYDRYLKLYGNSDPSTNTHRWAGIGVHNNGGNNVNELAFFAGIGDSARTEKMRIDSDGKVGIGTTNPQFPLDIHHGTPEINLYDTSSAGQFRFFLDGVAATIKNYSTNGDISIMTTGTGKVGIGTGAPLGKLDVYATSGNTTPGVGDGIYVGPSNAAVGMSMVYSNSGYTYSDFISRYDSSYSYMRFIMKGNATPVYAMTIRGSGNVGIGMTSPTASLGIQANATANGGYTNSNWARYLVLDAENTGGGGIIWTKQSSTYNRAIVNNQGKMEFGRSTANDASASWLSDFSIDAVGDSTFGGNIFIASTSDGIFLGGTSNANKLDDYEEGTWTPTIKDLSGNLATLSTASGTYTKIGRQVILNYKVTLSSKGSMTGNYVLMGGLPFNHPNNDYNGTGMVDYYYNFDTSYSSLGWDTSSTVSVMWLVGVGAGGSGSTYYVPTSAFGGNEVIKGTVIYTT